MFLDLAKALFFLFCMLSVYHAATHAFFMPGTRWEERLAVTLIYLAFSASVCIFSGLLFAWPTQTNPDRDQRLVATLPVRLFLWSAVVILALFFGSWYIEDLSQQAAPFISNHSSDRF